MTIHLRNQKTGIAWCGDPAMRAPWITSVEMIADCVICKSLASRREHYSGEEAIVLPSNTGDAFNVSLPPLNITDGPTPDPEPERSIDTESVDISGGDFYGGGGGESGGAGSSGEV